MTVQLCFCPSMMLQLWRQQKSSNRLIPAGDSAVEKKQKIKATPFELQMHPDRQMAQNGATHTLF